LYVKGNTQGLPDFVGHVLAPPPDVLPEFRQFASQFFHLREIYSPSAVTCVQHHGLLLLSRREQEVMVSPLYVQGNMHFWPPAVHVPPPVVVPPLELDVVVAAAPEELLVATPDVVVVVVVAAPDELPVVVPAVLVPPQPVRRQNT
jgi:hypothetical protein